jgi:uncharacterized coiled-coil protein SlyX
MTQEEEIVQLKKQLSELVEQLNKANPQEEAAPLVVRKPAITEQS